MPLSGPTDQSDQRWHRLPWQHAAGGKEQISDTHFGSGAKAVPSPSSRLRRSRTNRFKHRVKGQESVGLWVSAFYSAVTVILECSRPR